MRLFTDIEEAKKTVLRRTMLASAELGESAREKVRQVFGRELTIEGVVEQILADVRSGGDSALSDYSKRLDGVDPGKLEVDKGEIAGARAKVDPELVEALEQAAERIRVFHQRGIRQSWIETDEGGLGQWVRPLQRVGIYVPGGRASYPSTLLMTAIPARVAGVKEVVVTTPPSAEGVSAVTLLAAEIAGVDRVFRVGGAQAVAALAYGTESISRVDKICGPGNIFVQVAKRAVFGDVDIDGFYGPTETLILADDSADPALCAADMLAQAEHDAMASAILITTSASLASLVRREVESQLPGLDRRGIIDVSLGQRCGIVIVSTLDDGVALVNDFAPEHLSIMTRNSWTWAEKIWNAGGIFIGETSPEVVGDYVAGPSHVMPTGGTARFGSPLTVDDFLKVTSVVGIDEVTFKKIGLSAAVIARAEGLTAHARAAELRLAKNRNGRRK